MADVLYIVVPCYNEQEVLPETVSRLSDKLGALIAAGRVSERSRLLFVDDGSGDRTWELISQYHRSTPLVCGVRLTRNKGHQNALLAGLMTAREHADVTISMDADLQDDIGAVDGFLDKYEAGCDIVYGVRSSRDTDTAFKRFTALAFYRLMRLLGADTVYNHADYRLVSSRALKEFANFKEVNIFLRGMFPLVGFKSTCVYYERHERIGGERYFPLKKMLALAFDGITSLSIKPIRIITGLGVVISLAAFALIVYALVSYFTGNVVSGWASSLIVTCFLGGIQLISLGGIGEYIGKIYMETKARPRFIISERTEENK